VDLRSGQATPFREIPRFGVLANFFVSAGHDRQCAEFETPEVVLLEVSQQFLRKSQRVGEASLVEQH